MSQPPSYLLDQYLFAEIEIETYVPILGSLLLRPKFRKFADVLGYGLGAGNSPRLILWAAPQIPHRNAVTTLPELLKQAAAQIGDRAQDSKPSRPSAICLAAGRDRLYLDEIFDEVARPNATPRPSRPC